MFLEFTNGLFALLDAIRLHLPFSAATWFVLGILSFSSWMFMKASKDPKSPIQWEDMLIDSATGKTNPYKLGYLIGVIVSTWIVVTMNDQLKLTYDIFGLYLLYLVSGTGLIEWFKRGGGGTTVTPPVKPTGTSAGTVKKDEAD